MNIKKDIQSATAKIWRIRRKEVSRRHWFLLKQARVLLLTVRGLTRDRWQLRASALTFYSAMSVIPILALVFGIAKGFGFQETVQSQLYERFPGQEEIITRIVQFAHTFLETTKGGTVAGVGLVFLFWAVFQTMFQIEKAFNIIWGIQRPRSLGRRISDYLAIMIIGPVLFIVSSAATVFVATEVELFAQRIEVLALLYPAIFFMLKFLPFCVLWFLFTLLYIFMPNTKINIYSGIVGGIVAGTAYQAFQWGYITLQIGVSKYNAVYGSFAAIPLFLLWLKFSWMIVLFGAELSCAHQNVDGLDWDPETERISHSFKRLMALRIVHLLVRVFSESGRKIDAREIARHIEAPIPLVNGVLYDLAESGVVSVISGDEDGQVAYQPARDPDLITVKFVIDAIEENGAGIPIKPTEELEKLMESLSALDRVVADCPANQRLKDL